METSSTQLNLINPISSLNITNVRLHSLLNNKITMVKVFRRFNCPLTRYDAIVTSQFKSEFEKMGITMIGVGFDEAGSKEFIAGRFWGGELILDPEYEIYNILGLHRRSGLRLLLNTIKNETMNIFHSKSEFENVDDSQMGGTFILHHTGRVLYRFRQRTPSCLPNPSKILKVCQIHSKTLNNYNDEKSKISRVPEKQEFPHHKTRLSIMSIYNIIPKIRCERSRSLLFSSDIKPSIARKALA